MKKPTYKITKEHEEPKFATIEKGNVTVEFRIADMEEEQRILKQYITTYESELKLEEAKMENISSHHPHVLDLDDEERSNVYLYQEAKVKVDVINSKLPEFKKQLEDSETEQKEIMEKLGLNSKQAAVEAAVDKIVNHD